MRKSYGGTLARSALRLPLPPKPISFSLFANRERLPLEDLDTRTIKLLVYQRNGLARTRVADYSNKPTHKRRP
ncbi:MAG: hypothetical protein KatS3mg109_1379 [Pirellulaceae bacterium]|nr:MAG: hypothetical protein KatS3mg109_1379 [Pirellulaceae bacterium]GIW93705.1 MAG: hypothetical protein KatS3mg110_1746 [Pirellulaceae bacterium]